LTAQTIASTLRTSSIAAEPVPQPAATQGWEGSGQPATSSTGGDDVSTGVPFCRLPFEHKRNQVHARWHAKGGCIGGRGSRIDRHLTAIDDNLRDPHVGSRRRGHDAPGAGSDQHVECLQSLAHESGS
jgi:hypothetical protein